MNGYYLFFFFLGISALNAIHVFAMEVKILLISSTIVKEGRNLFVKIDSDGLGGESGFSVYLKQIIH